jgi:hypothetical protein
MRIKTFYRFLLAPPALILTLEWALKDRTTPYVEDYLIVLLHLGVIPYFATGALLFAISFKSNDKEFRQWVIYSPFLLGLMAVISTNTYLLALPVFLKFHFTSSLASMTICVVLGYCYVLVAHLMLHLLVKKKIIE